MLKGVDVSKYDGTIDWQKAKSSGMVDFAILRAGYGKLASQKDIRFEDYYKGAKAAGVPIGAYWYSYAKSVTEIQTEARVFLSVIKGKQFEYPVYLDFEEKSQFALGKATCTAMAKAFLDILEQAGYYAGMYCSSSYLNNYFTDEVKNRYTIWVAHYGVSKPSYSGHDIWQYSSTGIVPGIEHNCDLNYCYKGDFPKVIKEAGLNGFTKGGTVEPKEEKTIEQLAQEVLEGKWGNGSERKIRLISAGYDYSAVQNAVNELVKKVEEPNTPEEIRHKIEVFIDGERKYSGTLD